MTLAKTKIFNTARARMTKSTRKLLGVIFQTRKRFLFCILAMYFKERAAITGFGKSFEPTSYLDDLLSLPDLAAEIVQDMLAEHDTGCEASWRPKEDSTVEVHREKTFFQKFHCKLFATQVTKF